MPFASLYRGLAALVQSSAEIRDGVANQSALLNDKLGEVLGELRNEQRIIDVKLTEIVGELRNEQRIISIRASGLILKGAVFICRSNSF